MNQPNLAGVDVGGGGIRVRIEAAGSGAYEEASGPLPRDRDLGVVAQRVASAVEAAAKPLGLDAFAAAAIGMTGLPGLVKQPELLWQALRDRLGLTALVVAGDALTTHVGAFELRPGIVVAAGTGVFTLGTDLADVWNRSDGWGYLLGDHGSGAWIGRKGLQAALRTYDGRADGSGVLLRQMRAVFGEPLDVVPLVYDSPSPAHRLASFAPAVADAARAGDPVAAGIWQEAGRHLGLAALAAAPGLEPAFSWGGRLFDAGDLLIEPFERTVRAALPEARFTPPAGTSTDGALALARAAASGDLPERQPYLYVFSARAA